MAIKKQKLISARGSECFWINNGTVVCSLKKLESALEKMNDEQYKYHVTKDKNDFAQWVGEVLKNPECAKAISKVRTKKTTLSRVRECLKKSA
jgi:hypothetical protein